MDPSNVLSNDEVDALLDDEGNTKTKQAMQDIELVDFANIDDILISLRRLPVIDQLLQSELGKQLSDFLRQKVVITASSVSTKTFATYIRARPTLIYNLFSLPAHDNITFINLERSFVHHIVTILYGGDVKIDETIPDNFGHVSKRVAERLSKLIMDVVSQAWKEIVNLDHQFLQSSTEPHILTKPAREESLFINEYSIEFGDVKSNIHFCLQNSLLDQIKPLLNSDNKNEKEQQEEIQWHSQLRKQVQDCHIDLVAHFPKLQCKFHDLLNLKAGDVLPLPNPEQVFISAGNVKLFDAIVGTADGVRVIKLINNHKK